MIIIFECKIHMFCADNLLILRQIILIMRQFISCAFLFWVLYVPTVAQRGFIIPFAPIPIEIDGELTEWDLPLVIPHHSSQSYRNQVTSGLHWDFDYLYIAFKVIDSQLCLNESGDGNEKLYLSDAVEIYIDSQNDSKQIMDLNDYQFLISLTSDHTIFKGEKQQIFNGSHVPKDHEGTNIVIYTKSVIKGTINDPTDDDAAYTIEIAIPWSAIGIKPKEGLRFKIDLCNDDIDTTANMRSWPDDYHPPSFNFVNIDGLSDFGFPSDWHQVELHGNPSWKYAIIKSYRASSTPLLMVLSIIFLAFIIGFWYQNSKLRFYRNLPVKTDLDNTSTLYIEPTIDQPESQDVVSLSQELKLLKEYILSHLDKDISVENLASYLNISTRQLQRIMKAELNMTPKQFTTIIKLETAAQLLDAGHMTISEVAYMCGFTDPSYFGMVFKKYFGKTPMEYKKHPSSN